MDIQASFISCGIKQLYGLPGKGTPDTEIKRSLAELDTRIYAGCTCPSCVAAVRRRRDAGEIIDPSCRFLIFSDPDEIGNGMRFAQFLADNGFGKPAEVCAGTNPNTRNHIRLWAWELPDLATFQKLVK